MTQLSLALIYPVTASKMLIYTGKFRAFSLSLGNGFKKINGKLSSYGTF